ncbi:carboxymuconolactone decarboxylase family protein [Mucilaginibacter sp. KACC 22773]|uniref:carboxymuconolactone decarboxylase family protein n=1 Tax=Mucilaginibacter sp. KACC 22773 TaxID=3025671 RepID=UPI0023659A0D|nr:carboxymuconolactone decarboxylase family protein [Mucilaginibacter sp. KACC 22773]WDF81134.1 carboxymuconolactone decarboxylase family protein [Mucilaginibacter sp. KACC 22773]
MNTVQLTELNVKEQYIVLVASYTASGNLAPLKNALYAGLDAGLTINQIREELVQLYAYCGFPRSLNGITTLMSVLEERKSKGLKDEEGEPPTPVIGTNDSRYNTGKKTLEVLTGRAQNGPLTGANAFAPGIDAFLKEHLFADIFGRGVLTYVERELVTIAALSTLPGLEAQLQAHLGMGMNAGLTEAKLEQVFKCLEAAIGKQQADIARSVLVRLKTTN